MTPNDTPTTPTPLDTTDHWALEPGNAPALAPDVVEALAVAADATDDRALEHWPRADWRKIHDGSKYCASRNVGVALICGACQEQVVEQQGLAADGARLLTCPCTVRVWGRK